ncbi:hypothetical protein [uncultured Microbacterium sp.]|uniref:DoxX family protein n=1 Tax=uncultured Microbacterium sp. TaxID=191216 RepID=UPI0025FC2044|nr:hypothetical protein [uncultured Microbacterium sp.]
MRTLARLALAAAMTFAGLTHLFWGRKDFQAQVPDAVAEFGGLGKDGVVMASGAVEVLFGVALVALPDDRRRIGTALAAFFAAVFPGNIEQYTKKRSAFGLDTDARRLARLPFQAVLIAWALYATRR